MCPIMPIPSRARYCHFGKQPSDLPDPSTMDRVEEPYIKASIITKADYVGPVMSLCIESVVKSQIKRISPKIGSSLILICHWLKLYLISMIG